MCLDNNATTNTSYCNRTGKSKGGMEPHNFEMFVDNLLNTDDHELHARYVYIVLID